MKLPEAEHGNPPLGLRLSDGLGPLVENEMNVDRDGLKFSTGKTLYANRGIVGLCLTDDDDDRQGVFYGYDGGINTPLDTYVSPDHRMTPAECVELADEMLKRWAEFRATYARA